MELWLATVFAWGPNLVRLDWPRIWVRCESRTVKLEAIIDAVILRQSLQLQTNVATRPGAFVGWIQGGRLDGGWGKRRGEEAGRGEDRKEGRMSCGQE